jgi:hypothetical protein
VPWSSTAVNPTPVICTVNHGSAADKHMAVSRLTGVDAGGEITAASVPDGDDESNELSWALESKARYWPVVRSGCDGALATETASSRPSGFATLNPLPGGVIPLAAAHADPASPAAAGVLPEELEDPPSPAFTQL